MGSSEVAEGRKRCTYYSLSFTYSVVDKIHTWTCEIWFGDNLEYEIHDFKSYEEALSEGIKEAVKILKE